MTYEALQVYSGSIAWEYLENFKDSIRLKEKRCGLLETNIREHSFVTPLGESDISFRWNNISAHVFQGELGRVLVHESTPVDEKGRAYPIGSTFTIEKTNINYVYRELAEWKNSEMHTLIADKPVIVLGGSPYFGHFLLQCLLRLEVVWRIECHPVHAIIDKKTPLPFLELSQRLGLIEDYTRVRGCTFVKSLEMKWCSSPVYSLAYPLRGQSDSLVGCMGYSVDKTAALQLRLRIARSEGDDPKHYKRIMLIRGSSAVRRAVNTQELVGIAEGFSFIAIKIEDFAVSQQIDMLRNVEFLISEVGSGGCNSWLTPNLRGALELSNATIYGPWSGMWPASVFETYYKRLIGRDIADSKNGSGSRDSSFIVDERQFTIEVEKMLAYSRRI